MMRVVLGIFLAFFLGQTQSAPTGDCTNDLLAELQNCTDKLFYTADFEDITHELDKLMQGCLPGNQTNCTAKYDAADSCWTQLQDDVIKEPSMSVIDKKKNLVAIYQCVHPFPDDLWHVLENDLKKLGAMISPSSTPLPNPLSAGVKAIADMQAGNDPCTVDMKSLMCLVPAVMSNKKIMDVGAKMVEQELKCFTAFPESCRWPMHAGDTDCHSSENKPIVEKYRVMMNECLKIKGVNLN